LRNSSYGSYERDRHEDRPVHRVGLRVNKPENDDASLIEALPGGPAPHRLP